MDSLMTGRSIDCLLLEPGLMPKSSSSEASDVRPKHLDSKESADPPLGMVKRLHVRVIFQPPSLSGMPIENHFMWPMSISDCL